MGKLLKMLTAVMATAAIILTSPGAGNPWTAQAVQVAQVSARLITSAADAEELVEGLLGDDPASMDGTWQMVDEMESGMEQLGGYAGIAASLAALGKCVKIEAAQEGEFDKYITYSVPIVCENLSADIVLYVVDGKLSGLRGGDYTGGAENAIASGEDESEEDESEDEDVPYRTIELDLLVRGYEDVLPGTLTLPEGDGPWPVVILVQGSGPSDRDETVGALKPFKDLAEGLAERGIASYRYDKRTYVFGEEMAADHSITLEEETIEDAIAAVQLVAEQDNIDPSRIYVLGHSLGAMAIPAINEALQYEQVQAAGYVMMAAPARRLDQLMKDQYDFLYLLMPEVTDEMLAQKEEIFSELDRLDDPDTLTDDDMIAGAYAPYWKWLLDYDAVETAEDITLPCLLLQGEEDYQVTMEDDFAVWTEAYAEDENWEMISYPGLVHTFTAGLKSEGNAVYNKAETVAPEVIEDIAEFISKIAITSCTLLLHTTPVV